MKVALVGTRGVPARYGGFETCVEEVGRRLAERGHDVVVYCRSTGKSRPAEHLGMSLVHLPALRRRSLETLSHTGLSVAHLLLPGRRPDAAVVFNAANAPWLPVLRAARIPVATHVDGLEWQRAKWGRTGKRYYRAAEAWAVRWSDALIADARGIQGYYRERFDADTELIAYGAPCVAQDAGRLAELGLAPRSFHLVVARFEPENHVDVIVDGHRRSGSTLPLVVVGSAPYSEEYTRRIRSAADGRTQFLGGVWDQGLLDQLYANACTYLHGHSVGGTNPSLLRAAGAGAATIAFDVTFNREVLGQAGRYFRDADDVARRLREAEADPEGTRTRGVASLEIAQRYDWDDVAASYEGLCERLAAGAFEGRGGRHRRKPPTGGAQ